MLKEDDAHPSAESGAAEGHGKERAYKSVRSKYPDHVWLVDLSAPCSVSIAGMRAGFQPVAGMPPHWMKGSSRKGTVKLRRVPTGGLNKQSGLNCTGCVPPDAGRATTGSMVRQRSARRKPLYLICNSQWSGGTERRCDPNQRGFKFQAGDRVFVIDGRLTFLACRPVSSGVERATYGSEG
jgi:hypothetical protein